MNLQSLEYLKQSKKRQLAILENKIARIEIARETHVEWNNLDQLYDEAANICFQIIEIISCSLQQQIKGWIIYCCVLLSLILLKL